VDGVEHLQTVTNSSYRAMANPHTLPLTIASVEHSEFAVLSPVFSASILTFTTDCRLKTRRLATISHQPPTLPPRTISTH
jgi:hypothetical protein